MSLNIDYSKPTARDEPLIEGNRIGGRSTPGPGGVEVLDPSNGFVLAVVPRSGTSEIDAAVEAASAASSGWAAAAPQERAAVLSRWSELIIAHREELAATATAEMGKLLRESRGEVDRAVAEINFMAGESLRTNGETFPSATPGMLVYSTRVPVGTVAAITPWNFPIVAPVRKIAPALATGNTVVLKPAAEAPLSSLALVDLLREAGLPDGVVNVVCGSGTEAGAALIEHPGIHAVTFTGSTAVGRNIAETAGRRLIPVQLELGGKNAIYVDETADLERAVPDIVAASVQASGQRCTAISRVLVHSAVADALVERMASAYDSLTVGAGTDPSSDVGPLISERQKQTVHRYLQTSVDEGAVVVTTRKGVPDGNYAPPSVLDRVTPSMTVAREEVFGPVLSVIRVTGHQEAIEVANASEYGLAAAVFSNDMGVAMRFANEARAGMIHVNHGTASQPHVPFGGVGSSGMGPYSIGHTSQEFFTKMKVVYLQG